MANVNRHYGCEVLVLKKPLYSIPTSIAA